MIDELWVGGSHHEDVFDSSGRETTNKCAINERHPMFQGRSATAAGFEAELKSRKKN